MEIYVGNLDAATNSDELRGLFEPFGTVTRADVYPRGKDAFARMEMPDAEAGQAAIDALFGTIIRGKQIVVAECSGNQGDDEVDDLDDD